MLEFLDGAVDKTVVKVLQAGLASIMGGGVHEMRDAQETQDAQETRDTRETWDTQETRDVQEMQDE